ncbi:MAG: S8 family serine peptidase [Ignavibacteriales bacterium]|nr:MAG: S8 family serine peptidase [Ignavibacteriales bacterium]
MRLNAVVIFIIALFLNESVQSQTTYFIKYKANISFSEVDRRITEKTISDAVNLRMVSLPEFSLSYLAKGLGMGDEILGRIIKINFADDVDESNLVSVLSVDPDIEYIQKSTTYKMDLIPNDSLVSQQWALEKINAFDAWNIITGVDTVLLAIIDTGIEYFHPDLQNKIYYNQGEMGLDQFGNDKKSNSIDDDLNGFVDDYMGWDFVDRVGVPTDTNAGDFHNWDNIPYDARKGSNGNHGTFVGGIAGAEFNNTHGIAGVAPSIKLLNIRSFDNGGSGEEDDAAAAILYAVRMGAKVINMSWGDYTFSYVLRDVVRYAYSQNVVLIASSGNSGRNELHYPSGYSEVISVGNSTEEDFVAGNSTWGSTIDLVAPGTNIWSTDMEGKYVKAGGTSASAPFVSGTAALILSKNNFTNEEVRQILKSTTDDIMSTGWDLRSGAGRLNLERALRVLAPSNIGFTFPLMDYATNLDTILIRATVLSPYFVNYSLEVGSDITPTSWNTLISNGLNQFGESEIFRLDIRNFVEGIYTLRLLVTLNNGRTLEERVHFHVMRTPPQVIEVGLGPIYFGERSTINGEFVTNQSAIMRMYYRKYGEPVYNFVTLDGFNTNNQFVKDLHYGFIPTEIVQPNTLYQVYFEAENLAGLKTTVVDSTNNNLPFLIPTEDLPKPTTSVQMNFSLGEGTVIFPEPVSFLSNNNNELLSQPFREGTDFVFFNYYLNGDQFSQYSTDSLLRRYPLRYGDFNNNGLKDLLTINQSNILMLEQTQAGSFSFVKKDSSAKLFYPILVNELLNDGVNYIITQNESPDRYLIWKVNSDLSTSLVDSTFYITRSDSFGSNYTTRSMIVDDIDNDGTKEIWFVDEDGDLKSYKVNPGLVLTKSDSLNVFGLSPAFQQDVLSSGDYNGDGIKDIAILYSTNSIAPAFLLLVVTFSNHSPVILTQKVFLDQSEGYGGGLGVGADVYQSLKFVDVDSDGKDELVVNIFPSSYIFKNINNEDEIIFYSEGSNTKNVFAGDLNQNGVPEISFKINDVFRFFEFANSNRAAVPVNFSGYSVSPSSIRLTWQGSGSKFYIYRGEVPNNLALIDSSQSTEYSDSAVQDSVFYYYSVQAYDLSKPEPYSSLSRTIEVYSHAPGKPVNAVSNSNRSIIVTFSEKMKNVIENLQSFLVPNFGYPNSVSPNTQYSYLLTFNSDLPTGTQQIIISDIKDLYNSPIQTDTLSFNVNIIPDVESFYISSFEIINSNRIKIIFNFNVDASSAMNPDNYEFSPENSVTSVEIDQSNPKVIYLNINKQKPIGSIGKEYRLRLSNIMSSSMIPINEGAGSYLVLTSFAKDLSDVYVYPNPAKVGDGLGTVTFANLPQKARINIWTVSGKFVTELEENDGDGGFIYDLKNNSGEDLDSGVYIYRVIRLDNTNNEVEEKLGKFAVLK